MSEVSNVEYDACPLIDGTIYCQCGKPSSHYGTMGVRGARQVREEAPPKAKSGAEEKGKSPLIVTRGDGIPLPDQAAALEEFKRQCLSSVKPPEPVFLIFYDDQDRQPEVFMRGGNAEVAARQRFEQVLGRGWNAHLFQRIDDGKRPMR